MNVPGVPVRERVKRLNAEDSIRFALEQTKSGRLVVKVGLLVAGPGTPVATPCFTIEVRDLPTLAKTAADFYAEVEQQAGQVREHQSRVAGIPGGGST